MLKNVYCIIIATLSSIILVSGCGFNTATSGVIATATVTATSLPAVTPTTAILHPCPPVDTSIKRPIASEVSYVTLPKNSIIETSDHGTDEVYSFATANVCTPDTSSATILEYYKGQLSTWSISSIYPYTTGGYPLVTVASCKSICWTKEDSVQIYVTLEAIVEKNGQVTYTIRNASKY